jgi:hypothetical protein
MSHVFVKPRCRCSNTMHDNSGHGCSNSPSSSTHVSPSEAIIIKGIDKETLAPDQPHRPYGYDDNTRQLVSVPSTSTLSPAIVDWYPMVAMYCLLLRPVFLTTDTKLPMAKSITIAVATPMTLQRSEFFRNVDNFLTVISDNSTVETLSRTVSALSVGSTIDYRITRKPAPHTKPAPPPCTFFCDRKKS